MLNYYSDKEQEERRCCCRNVYYSVSKGMVEEVSCPVREKKQDPKKIIHSSHCSTTPISNTLSFLYLSNTHRIPNLEPM